MFALSAAAAVLPGAPVSVPSIYAASAGDTDNGLPVRSAEEIAAMWKTHMNPRANKSRPFLVQPSVTAPYAPGTLRGDYLQDGLNALNFYRFISGLPADVELSEKWNEQAAYGALLLASEGNFDHEPPKPADMTKPVYDLGLASTSSANLFASYGYDHHVLFASIEAYMEDSDPSNLDRLGHRRWILNPPLKLTGMGLAEGTNGYSYSALQVFDSSRKETVDYRYLPYPARGAFPVEVFTPRTAWSVILDPEEYAEPSADSVKVTLKRQRDGQIWKFDSAHNKVTESGKYMGVEGGGYGAGPAVIFRPDGVERYLPGDAYEVRIDGLTGIDGSAQTIAYAVQFVSAQNPASPSAAFTDTSSHWAREAIDWAADRGIVSGYPDGSFKPAAEVTEAEFLRMFTAATGAEIRQSGYWSDAYYAYAETQGFKLRGLEDPGARSEAINRTAVAELFASAAGLTETGDNAIRYMLDNGYSMGKTAATVSGYRGEDALTRAEAVQFIKNALDAGYALTHPEASEF